MASSKPTDTELIRELNTEKYGFKDPEDYVFKSEKGLSASIVRKISAMKEEPEWMLNYRLKALDHYQKMPFPKWGPDNSNLDLDDLYYYVRPTDDQSHSWDDVPENIKNTFDRLGIPEAEQKFLAGVGAQYESEMVSHSR